MMINKIAQTPNIPLSPHIDNPSGSSKSCVRKMTTSENGIVKKNGIKREPAEINFCGLFSPQKMEKLYKNPKFHKILNMAKTNQAVFQASFALLLTCILRPGAILVVPSKKNKEDQIYASAHSIASGIIGFGISTILLDPFTKGINKFLGNMKQYLKEDSKLLSKNEAIMEATNTYMGRLTDWVPAIPKGILTVALIPPILKYVFGVQKHKPSDKKETPIQVDYSLLNFKSAEVQDKNVYQHFLGGVK